ncbi:Spore Coat Protein U domain-containing protein [Persephonella hydrogeniphila]|uniref:Spore Coat Protein U domain-containing protein n=1 Tax=Persephonella hydrogeniphila TaxID=198703 RepID=A0A285NEK3_9AQUI|nr:spore coat protein U domain-containing protein [Persephonella hydrogeniphila]SNZ07932.1 Spore Coat Protein U domain-containing protein [Persephonella hydrogeniphila]
MKHLKSIVLLITFALYSISFAQMSGSCSADMENIYFGNYNPFEPVVKRAYGTLRLSCSSSSANIFFSVKVIGGNSPDPAKRYLYSPSTDSKLYYNLYYKNCVLGDGTNGTCVISGRIGKKHGMCRNSNYFIVAIIPPMQNVSAASDYQDHLTVIIEY